MDMSNNSLDILRSAGVDTFGALQRFMNNEKLYKKFLLRFLDDKSMVLLTEAIKEEDMTKVLNYAHTLKGICGNLGLLRMYEASAAIVSTIRCGKEEDVCIHFKELNSAYVEICNVIQQVKGCS